MGNIAFFHRKFPAGGAETVTLDVASMFKDDARDIYIFSYELEVDKFPEHTSNVKTIKLPFPNNDEENYPLILSKVRECEIKLLIIPVDINYFPFVERIKRDADVKVAFVMHSVPFWEYLSKIYKVERKIKGSFIKRLEWYFLRYPKYKLGFKFNAVKKKYVEIYNKVDIFGVLTEGYGRELANVLGIEYSSSKIRVFPNCVKEVENVCEEKKREVYYIGRLKYVDKRVDRVLRVWSLVEKDNPEWSLKIVGSGDEYENLLNLKEKLNLQRVSFMGYTANTKEYYDRAAIVCMTSSIEGWGMVLLEAQSNQCATIAFNSSAGIEEILSPSWQNGVLIEPFDEKAYAEALSRLMNDDKLRNEIAKNGRMSVKRFSTERTLCVWKSLLSELNL